MQHTIKHQLEAAVLGARRSELDERLFRLVDLVMYYTIL